MQDALDIALDQVISYYKQLVFDPYSKLTRDQKLVGLHFLEKWDEYCLLARAQKKLLSKNLFITLFYLPFIFYFGRKAAKKYIELEKAQIEWLECRELKYTPPSENTIFKQI